MKNFLALVLVIVLAPIVVAQGSASAATYEQPLFKTWPTKDIDVIVVPPHHGQVFNGYGPLNRTDPNELNPLTTSYLKAVEKSLRDWDRAVATFGTKSLKRGWRTDVYVLGRDVIPADVLSSPEIIFVADEWKFVILGMSMWTGLRPQTCISNVSMFFDQSFTYADMYNVAGHELGHCLGLDHPTGPGETIKHDIMHATYEDAPGRVGTHRHCASNLNVMGLGWAFDGRHKDTDVVSMSSKLYRKIRC